MEKIESPKDSANSKESHLENAAPTFQLNQVGENTVIQISGSWSLVNLPQIFDKLGAAKISAGQVVILDGTQISELDTSGAMLLLQLVIGDHGDYSHLQLKNFSEVHSNIIELVRSHIDTAKGEKEETKAKPNSLLVRFGKATLDFVKVTKEILPFVGKTSEVIAKDFLKPWNFRIKEFFVQLEQVFVNAIPVIILVTFMIGVVVSYISAEQIKKYGVSLFIVDGISLAMLRELSPAIVAIVVAGRSGSAFTAQLGTMKMNDEIDAITILGLSPLRILVVPRLLALILTIPLLVFIGDVVGISAGMLIADIQLNLSPSTFLDRFQTAIPVRWALLGFLKAPVFAMCIAIVGCRNGMNSASNAQSVGLNTTATVVQSIVSVIIFDAIFAVIFQELEI